MDEYSDFNSDSSSGLYDALGVSPRASYTEIKRAFHKKAKVMSPDRHLNHPNWKAVNEKVQKCSFLLTENLYIEFSL